MTVAVVGLVCSDQLTLRVPCVSLARFPSQLGSTLVTVTLCAFDLSFVHASAGSWRCKEHGKHKRVAGSTLSVPFVLFVHKK